MKRTKREERVPRELWADLESEAARIVAEGIGQAFARVSREGGTSWSESVVVDNYGDEVERAAARALDLDRHWTELVDDPQWQPDVGIGGFSFLDPIAFRYYLPATMIRGLRSPFEDVLEYRLTPASDDLRAWWIGKWSLFEEDQLAATARYVRWMMRHNSTEEWYEPWTSAYSYWATFDPDALPDRTLAMLPPP